MLDDSSLVTSLLKAVGETATLHPWHDPQTNTRRHICLPWVSSRGPEIKNFHPAQNVKFSKGHFSHIKRENSENSRDFGRERDASEHISDRLPKTAQLMRKHKYSRNNIQNNLSDNVFSTVKPFRSNSKSITWTYYLYAIPYLTYNSPSRKESKGR